jgi:hypothetical protein
LAFLFVLVFMAIVCAKIFFRLLPYLIIGAAILVVLAFISRYPWLLIFVVAVFAIIYGPRIAKAFAVPAPPPPLPDCQTLPPPPLTEAAKKLSPSHIPARQKTSSPLRSSEESRIAKPPGYRPKVLKAQHLRLTSGATESDSAQFQISIPPDDGEQNRVILPPSLGLEEDKEAGAKRRDKQVDAEA